MLLARALAVQAQVLLMDEPLANLDPPHQADWLAWCGASVARGGTVVSVLHEIVDGPAGRRPGGAGATARVVHHGATRDAGHAPGAGSRCSTSASQVHAVAGQWVALPREEVAMTGTLRDGAGHHQRRRQELAGHRAVPLVRAPGPEGGALQGAEHEQQRAGGGRAPTAPPARSAAPSTSRPWPRGAVPDVRMNPVLLKPERDTHSQVVLLGQVDEALGAHALARAQRARCGRTVQQALDALRAENDVVVIEGAGSPAEINLRDSDIVNLRVARTRRRAACW